MATEKPSKIDIPESIEGYQVTLFWGLGLTQIVLVFLASLFLGFGIFNLFTKRLMEMLLMFVIAGLILLAIAEVRGRNFYRHLLFIFSYYKTKPKVLIYHHYSSSGQAAASVKQLVYQKDNHTKIFIIITLGLLLGLLLLTLTGVYIYHVIHK